MSKLYPGCGYFNEERDSEFAPDDGECESCYRYDICSNAKNSEIVIRFHEVKKDSIMVVYVNSDEACILMANELNSRRNSFKQRFPEIKTAIVLNEKKYNDLKIYDRKEYINKLKDIIKELEDMEENINE